MAQIEKEHSSNSAVSFLLRIGLAGVFIYAGIAALINPFAWVGFVPQFITKIISAQTFLHIHSVGEIILALWLLSGRKIFYAAVISALDMLAVMIFNLSAMDIVFRDFAIFFMAVALVVMYKQNKK